MSAGTGQWAWSRTATESARRRRILLVVAAIGFAVAATVGLYSAAHSRGFVLTGSMATARGLHTATTLQDGRVLVAGGEGRDGPVASAELYDTKTGSFTPTGSMKTAREGATGTLLKDGRVLVAGGWVESTWGYGTPTAELYDPSTGTFSATGPLPFAGGWFTATLLDDGRVLIAGGLDSDFNTRSQALLYDPVSGQFFESGWLRDSRAQHSATLLADGRVLIAGGWMLGGEYGLASAEVYDPIRGLFTTVGSMTAMRWNHTATLLGDGRVLVAGGMTSNRSDPANDGLLDSSELFDPATAAFVAGPSMTTQRAEMAAITLSSGRVLLAGGVGDGATVDIAWALSSAEVYDPATRRFSATGGLRAASVGPVVVRLRDGRVLVTGGWCDGEPLDVAELYGP